MAKKKSASKAKPASPKAGPPTPDEIKKEIKVLKNYRERIRPTSMFGDDHKASIGAQIEVLEKNLSDDRIYDLYEPSEEEQMENAASTSSLDNALEARRWLDGESEDGSPSEAWKSLLIK